MTNIARFLLQEVSKIVKSIEFNRGMVVARGWERGNEELLINGHQGSVKHTLNLHNSICQIYFNKEEFPLR